MLPNPLNPERYVLIFSGEYWGERLDINHKYDSAARFHGLHNQWLRAREGTNEHLCAGFLTSTGNLTKMTWVR